MTIVRIEQVRPWYAPWKPPRLKATWRNGERTFVHGHYLFSTQYFNSFRELFDWADKNCWHLDRAPGGMGYTQLCLRIGDLQIRDVLKASGMTTAKIEEKQKTLIPKVGLINEWGYVE